MTWVSRLLALAGLVVLLAGCDALEPYDRAATWHLTGANEANLAAMASNPADLVHGRGTTGASDGTAAVAPIDRLRRDHVKPLPDSSSTSSSTPAAAAGLTAN